jgi:hypothetical protein
MTGFFVTGAGGARRRNLHERANNRYHPRHKAPFQ